MKWTVGQTLLLWTAFFVAMNAYAGGNFTYTGRILDAAGNPVVANSVRFTLTIYEPTGKCWLYTEQRELDLSASSGTFSIDIGANDASLVAATALFNGSVTGPQTMRDVFDNVKSYSGLGGANGCTGIYTPNSSEPNVGRLLSVFFTVDGGPNQALPVLKINPVPAALQAYAVNGFGSGELLKINPTDVAASSVPNNALTQVQYEEFWRLVKNPLAAYLPVSGDVTLVSGNNKLTTLLGQALPAGPATNGQVLVSNGTTWTLQAVGSGSVTSVGATAPIASSGGATPTISISKADSSTDGYLDKSDFAAFSAKQANTLADGAIWVGNSSGGAQARAVSGDATLSNAGVLTLSSTITAGGPVGTSGYVPVITYDAKGRLTAVTSAAVNDASKLPLAGGTMSGAINMGGQDLNNVGNINMAANKYFGLSANGTDGTVAGQMWYDGGVIKYFDGSTVKSLGVAGAGITNLNGLSAVTQSFAIGTLGNAPAFNSVTSTHTLNIPMASASGSVTAGLLSNAEYAALNAKQSSALASANVWVGNASGAAQARTLTGDISIDNAGATSLAAIKGKSLDATAATTMGQVLFFDSVADKWKVSAAAAPTNGQVMKWNDTTKTWEPGNDTGGWTAVDASYAAKGIVQFDTNAATSGINVSSGVANVVRTTTGTANTIVALDAFGTTNLYGLGMLGSVSGTVLLKPSAVTSNYALTLPNLAPGAGQSLQSDASGNLTWVNGVTTATGIVKDGNSFGSNLVIGTNDNYDFSFEANGATAMTIKPNGNIGIGTADPLYKLFIEDTTINNPDKRMAVTRAVSQSTVDGAYTSIGSDSRVNEAVATGVTNTGTVRGSWIAAQRNAQLGVDDDGTLTNLEGAVLQYGHFAVNTAADPKTTNLYGIRLDANYRRGTITNLYDLYIGAGTGGGGTVSNHYSLYQQSSTAKNYFNGFVGIGALTPATKLDVSGVTRTTGLDVNATYGGSQVSLRAPGAFTSYTLTLPTTVGTSGQFLQTNGSGVLSWAGVTVNDATKLPLAGGTMSGAINMGGQDITNAGNISMAANKYFGLSANGTDGTVAGQMWYDSGTIKYFDGSTVKLLGVAGASVANLNGLTSATQTFAIGTSGNSPAFNSATNTHTLNIPMASSAGTVTAGLLSNAEYAALNNKQSSTLANGQVWVGNASNVATATNPATLFVMKGGQAGAVSLGSSDANNLTLLTNNTARLTIDSSGNIGIGAGSVLNKPLDIVGTGATIAGLKRTDDSDGFHNILSLTRTRSSATLPGAGFGGSIAFSGEYDNANNTTAMGFLGALWENNQTGALANANSAMTFSTAAAGVTNEHVRITSQGRVGINTPSPSYPLSVAGTIESTSGGYRFPDGTTQTTAATNVAASALTNSKVWVGNASNKPVEVSLSGDVTMDNAGVTTVDKTTTAVANKILQLDANSVANTKGVDATNSQSTVYATSSASLKVPAGGVSLSVNNWQDTSGTASYIKMNAYNTSSNDQYAYIGTVSTAGAGAWSPAIVFGQTTSSTAYAETMRIHSNNFVGIGATAPATKLDVSGVTRSTGLDVNATYGGSQASIRAPASFTSYTLTLPTTVGTNGQVLTTNGAGVLTWTGAIGAVSDTANLANGKIWVGNASGKAAEVTMSGDVTITNAGVATVDKTQTAVASKILQLTASSVAVTKGADIGGASTGIVSLRYPSTATNTTLTFPSAAGTANQFLQTNGSGTLVWATPAASLPSLVATNIWVGNASGGPEARVLSGDVSAISNTGSVTVVKTTTGTSNTIVSTDGTGTIEAYGYGIKGTTSGTVDLLAQATTANYSLRFPAAAPAVNQILQSDASGNFSWVNAPTGGGALSAITAATSTNTIDSLNFAQTWNWSTATTQSPLSISANALTTGSLLNLTTSNASLNSSNGLLQVANTGASTSGTIARIQSNSTSGSGLTVLANGNVGIGTTAPGAMLEMDPLLTSSSGIDYGFKILPTVNGSGTQGYTGIFMNLTQTAAGSGTKNLIDLQLGGASRFRVDTSGNLTANGVLSANGGASIAGTVNTNQVTASNISTTVYASTAGFAYPSGAGGYVSIKNTGVADGAHTHLLMTTTNASSRAQNAYIGVVSTTGAATYSPAMAFGIQTGSASYAESMRIDASGNLGVGTTSPQTGNRLDVQGGAIAAGSISAAAGNGGQIRMYEIGSPGANYVGFKAPDAITTDRIWTLPAADGTANQVLQTNGSGVLSWVSPVTTSTGIVKDGNSFGAHLIIGTNDNYDFRFESNGATAMTIEPSGEVGIGTTTPGYKLDVATTDGSAIRANTYSATAGQGSNVMLYRARGTAAAPAAVQANDTLGGLYARGYGASSFGSSSTGYVEFSASQTFTEANRGTYMSVYTTADNSSSPVERVRVADDGNVGVGITNPTSLLHVGGGNVSALTYGNREVGLTLSDGGLLVAGAGPEIVFKNNPASGASAYASIAGIGLGADGSGTYGGIAIATKKATTGATLSESMRIDNSGDVGIGTTNPLVGLMVEKDNGNGYAGWFRKSNTSNGVGLGSTVVGGIGMIQGLTTAGGVADLALNPNGGLVGVGMVPTGAARLQVSATPTNASLFAVENLFKGDITASGTYYSIGLENNITKRVAAGVTDSGYLLGMRANVMRNFTMTGVDTGTLESLAGLAIQYGHYNGSATAPQTNVAFGMQISPHIMTGSIGTMYDLMLSAPSTGGTVGTYYGLYAGGVNKLNFFEGKLGIGTNGPDEKLVVYNGSTYGRYTTSGWTHSSDVRLKTDIQPLNDSLNKILQLDGVSYKFKSDPEGKKQVGFIAQEVEPIFPEVVTTDKDGMKSMIYSNLVAPLVESVKALYAKITAHDEKFKQLEAENQAMKEALCELGKQQFCSQKRVPASN
ncbi:tail fiber domain-containing protein [Bdellovibrio sp. HCB337]|uniref:tail fiber domain-containing protein n=1 Tax=Bdellovibrio sp. HCB337 TaxID=3394358 RepID=UPI0039A6C26E